MNAQWDPQQGGPRPSELVVSSSPDAFAALWEHATKESARAFFRLESTALPPGLQRALRDAQRAAKAAMRTDRGLIDAIFGSPSARVFAHLLAAQPPGATSVQPQSQQWAAMLACRVLAELAWRGRLAGLDASCPAVVLEVGSPALGKRLRAATETAAWHFSANGVHARGRHGEELPAAPQRDVYWEVAPGTVLCTVDPNPLALIEAHPDKSGNAIDLGGHSPAEWSTALQQALDLVELTLPALRAEMRLGLREIMPVGYDEERHLSASYTEAVGGIYVSLHPQPLTMMEAVIHEFQHNKLNALALADPLLLNAWEPLFPSPVRPDLRPLFGVLLAAHAFVPVAEVYLALWRHGHPLAQRQDFPARLKAIAATNREACATLHHALPTPAGRELLHALESRMRAHDIEIRRIFGN